MKFIGVRLSLLLNLSSKEEKWRVTMNIFYGRVAMVEVAQTITL